MITPRARPRPGAADRAAGEDRVNPEADEPLHLVDFIDGVHGDGALETVASGYDAGIDLASAEIESVRAHFGHDRFGAHALLKLGVEQ